MPELYVVNAEPPRIRLEDMPSADALPKPVADPMAKDEARQWEVAAKREHYRGLAQDNQQRKVYAERVFYLLSSWIGGLFGVLLCQGFKPHMFSLSENVILALIGGTTVNIVGIFLVVMRYLFPKR